MQTRNRSEAKAGAALLTAVLFMLVLGGMSAALVSLNVTFHREHTLNKENTKAFYAAEAGVNEALGVLLEQGEAELQALAYPKSLGAASYDVDIDFGPAEGLRQDRIRLQSVGDSGKRHVGVQLMIQRVPSGFFRWAIFGDDRVQLESNVVVDSWDSNAGPYPGTSSSGSFGNVGSNANIDISSNTEVRGDVIAGPTGLVDDSASGVTITGETGSATSTEAFPPITVPGIGVTDPFRLVWFNQTLAPGDHHIQNLAVLGGTLTIQGPARIVVDDLLVWSDAGLVIDASGGPVELYATGDFELRSNSSFSTTSSVPRDVGVYLTSDEVSSNIEFDANGDCYGTVYAPNAAIDISSNFTLFGAIKAREVRLASNTEFHFDEDLLYDPGVPTIYERHSWRKMSRSEVQALGF